MKTAGSNTLANLASSQFVKAELWDLTLAGGTVLRFTDFDHPLTLGANVYASNMVITRGSINQRIGLDPQTLDVQMSPQADAPSPATIGGASFLRAAKLGALSGARMVMRKIFAAKPTDGSATVKTNGESVLWYAGIVDDVEVGQMTANLVLNPDVSLLNVQMPRNVIQPGCLHSLFDAGCGLAQSSFQVAGTITSGATSMAFGATGFGSQPDTYFALGRVYFNSGANSGHSRTVKTYLNSGGAFTVFDPLPTAPAAGDTFLAIAGCDKQQATCSSKFSNLSRFRGYPYVPVPETLYDGGSIAIPAPTVGGQGTPGTGSLWPSNLPNGYTPMTPAQRELVVAEAASWIGTPYVHMGRLKGVGVDCAQLLILVYAAAGVVEDFDPGTYTHDWYLHRGEELYLGHLLRYAEKVDEPQPGDVAGFRFGRTMSHAGIVTEPGYMVHAYRPCRRVERMEIRAIDFRLDGYFRVRA